MASKATVRKGMWVRIPQPAPSVAARTIGPVPHVRPLATVESALAASDAGVPDAENARTHGVAVKTIRRWRRLYQRRGLPRGQQHLAPPCPRCDGAALDEPAYAELLGWYLGDGHITLGRRGVYALHIYNDQRYVVLNGHIKELDAPGEAGQSPPQPPDAGVHQHDGLLEALAVPVPPARPGRKHDRPSASSAGSGESSTTHPADLLRGLFHSDGSRTNNWATQTVAGVCEAL